jgi:hypothetical protein
MVKLYDWVTESEGEVRALKHILCLVKLNLKSARERLKEAKEERKKWKQIQKVKL